MNASKSPPTLDHSMAPQVELYNRSFFDRELRGSRKLLSNILLLPLLYTALLMWGCLSFYWGSTMSSSLNGLQVYAVNLDNDQFGQQMLQGIREQLATNPNNLGWIFDQSIVSDVGSRELVLDEQAWAVVQVNANVTSNFKEAVLMGNASYNAQSAVTVYFASARNQITTNSKTIPGILAVINPILAQLGGRMVGETLGPSVGNATAVATALQCRGCLSPFGAAQVDLINFDVPQATGSTMVGLIFLLTFTFTIFQILHLAGDLIGAKLMVRDAIIFRSLAAMFSYLLLSLCYTLINLAFQVPMNRAYGGGFFIYWMLNFFTQAALGLPMESLFTMIGLKWAPYFLSFWIVVNVASGFSSFEVMPGFYRYGYGFPFFNSIQGARTVIFGTKSHLGQNFGVLLAWMMAGLIGMAISTAHILNENRKKRAHAIR